MLDYVQRLQGCERFLWPSIDGEPSRIRFVSTWPHGGLLPTFADTPGFLNFGLADIGDHKVVSISIWDSREAAEKSALISASWVKENVSDRVRLVTGYVGNLALFHGVPVAA